MTIHPIKAKSRGAANPLFEVDGIMTIGRVL
jgi:hypothetical protein